jgi:hemerythrin-like domain-containing protein
MNNSKIKTLIEKELHGFIENIKEHLIDYTVLYVRRHKPHIDREQLTEILEIVRGGIDDSYFSQIDKFINKMNVTLDSATESEPTEKTKKSPKTSAAARD